MIRSVFIIVVERCHRNDQAFIVPTFAFCQANALTTVLTRELDQANALTVLV